MDKELNNNVISDMEIDNVPFKVNIGAAENRNRPETIFIEISFWIKNKSKNLDNSYLKKKLRRDLRKIYIEDLKDILTDNFYFPKKNENLFIINMPDNINYNEKKNFVSIELYLHTINNSVKKTKSYPLSKKRKSYLYDEALKISNIIKESSVLKSEFEFDVSREK